MQLTKAYVTETSCNQLLIDSATSLLMIYLPILNNVAMSFYIVIALYYLLTYVLYITIVYCNLHCVYVVVIAQG